jgi:hypothetical protein
MPTESEIESARCVIRDHIRAYWEAEPEAAEKMVDGYRAMAKAALEAAERERRYALEGRPVPHHGSGPDNQ